MASPTILLYGNFEWFHLATSYQDAFQELGCRVLPFDIQRLNSSLSMWTRHRLLHRLTIRSLWLRRLGSRLWNRDLLACAVHNRPDLVVLLNGDFVMPETVRGLRALGARVFIFHADNPFPPHYARRPETLPCARESDAYFIWSQHLVDRLMQAGVPNARFLAFGWDPKLFPHDLGAEGSVEPEHDLVFIGGWDKEREGWLTPIAQRYDLKIWGPHYWGTRTRPGSPLRGCWQGKTLLGRDAARVLTNSKIVLNILRRQNLPDGVIMRTFEVPGCGGFMLSTRTRGAEQIYPENQAGAYFSSMDDCCDRIEYFLPRASRRQEIARNAHDITRRGHQYVHRAQELLNTYDAIAGP